MRRVTRRCAVGMLSDCSNGERSRKPASGVRGLGGGNAKIVVLDRYVVLKVPVNQCDHLIGGLLNWLVGNIKH